MAERFLDIVQIILADIVLSGDNALVIGMAAANVAVYYRRKVLIAGMAVAAGLRILFAIVAGTLMAIPGVLFMGGLLLCWVCWRFYGEIRFFTSRQIRDGQVDDTRGAPGEGSLGRALWTVVLADVSMSLDNIVAVAAIARDDAALLAFGLGLSIILMTFCASVIMRFMVSWPALSWLGLGFLVYLAVSMLLDGWEGIRPVLARAIT